LHSCYLCGYQAIAQKGERVLIKNLGVDGLCGIILPAQKKGFLRPVDERVVAVVIRRCLSARGLAVEHHNQKRSAQDVL